MPQWRLSRPQRDLRSCSFAKACSNNNSKPTNKPQPTVPAAARSFSPVTVLPRLWECQLQVDTSHTCWMPSFALVGQSAARGTCRRAGLYKAADPTRALQSAVWLPGACMHACCCCSGRPCIDGAAKEACRVSCRRCLPARNPQKGRSSPG